MERGHPCPQSVRSTLESLGTKSWSHFALMRTRMSALQLQSHILKLKRLAFDPRRGRRDPVRDLANFSYRFHQAAYVFAVFSCRQPFGFRSFEFFFRDQISFEIEVVTGILAHVPVKANVRQI